MHGYYTSRAYKPASATFAYILLIEIYYMSTFSRPRLNSDVSEFKQICRLRSNRFCTLIVIPEIFDVAHIFVRSPPFSLKMISHKTTFEEIF